MSWICPTCSREVPLYESECRHCQISPAPRGEEKPPEVTPAAAAPAPAAEEGQPDDTPAADSAYLVDEPIPASARGMNPPSTLRLSRLLLAAFGLVLAAVGYTVWNSSKQVTLRVESEPLGARVTVDDRYMGVTPLELRRLREGQTYSLQVEREGFEPSTQSIVAARRKEPLVVTLDRAPNPLLDEEIVAELVGQIRDSGRDVAFSHEMAETLFSVNPLIEQNPWLTERAWTQIFRQVVAANFEGDSEEFLAHLRDYKAELARGKTSKQAWYQHVHDCEKVCSPIVTEVFKRHLEWLRRSGFTVIHFPINQHELADDDQEAIRRFVDSHKLASGHDRQVLLVGRASRIGAREHNLELSRRRVEAVAEALAAQLPDGRARLRTTHLGFEPPQITSNVVAFLGLDPTLTEEQQNQSVMLIVSEPIPDRTRAAAEAPARPPQG